MMDGWMGGGWMGRWVGGWMDVERWMGGWMDGWVICVHVSGWTGRWMGGNRWWEVLCRISRLSLRPRLTHPGAAT